MKKIHTIALSLLNQQDNAASNAMMFFTFKNFKTTQNVGKYWQLSFTMRNLLNAKISKTQVYKGQTYFAESFQIGRTFGLGISFRFK